MSINVQVNEELMRSALHGGEGYSEDSVVEAALRLWIQLKSQADAGDLWGKYKWEGNLEESRLGHVDE